MRRLVLLRHGKTEGTDRGLYYGETDLPLTREGLRELEEHRAGYPALTGLRVYTTGLLRTEQTLRAVYGDVPHGVLPGFREIRFGAFEMKSSEELKCRPDYQAWITGDFWQNVPPGGESLAQAEARALKTLEELLARGEDALVVAHGGTASAVMRHLFPEDARSRYDWIPQPGGGYEVNLKNHTYQQFPG
jgi:alpha-ribazole phosphatase